MNQGGDFELTCEVSGTPYPTVVWSIVSLFAEDFDTIANNIILQNGAKFEQNTRQTGNVLRILNARPENSGIYICLASNDAGSDQASTTVEIERKFYQYLYLPLM